MRRNRRERRISQVVAIATLAVGYFVTEPAEQVAARVLPGMTPAEVETAVGVTGRPSEWQMFYLKCPNPSGVAPEELEQFWAREREDERQNRMYYRDYPFPRGTVLVLFKGPESEERVVESTTHRKKEESLREARILEPPDVFEALTLGGRVTGRLVLYLGLWALLGGVLGLTVAEFVRRHRISRAQAAPERCP